MFKHKTKATVDGETVNATVESKEDETMKKSSIVPKIVIGLSAAGAIGLAVFKALSGRGSDQEETTGESEMDFTEVETEEPEAEADGE